MKRRCFGGGRSVGPELVATAAGTGACSSVSRGCGVSVMLATGQRSATTIPSSDVDGVWAVVASTKVDAVMISASLGCVPTIFSAFGYILVDFPDTSVRG